MSKMPSMPSQQSGFSAQPPSIGQKQLPSIGSKLPGSSSLGSTLERDAPSKFNLPQLNQQPQPSRANSGAGSGGMPGSRGSRYLRMARYQPGQEQTPAVPSAVKPQNVLGAAAARGLAGPGRQGLPDVGGAMSRWGSNR